MREIVFDTETTGLDPVNDRIVEIGCVELLNHIPTGRRLQLYVNPGRRMSAEAIAVHGITEAFLADKPPFGQVVDELVAFIGDAPLIAHNADFDFAFLNAELARVGLPPLAADDIGRVVDHRHDTGIVQPGRPDHAQARRRPAGSRPCRARMTDEPDSENSLFSEPMKIRTPCRARRRRAVRSGRRLAFELVEQLAHAAQILGRHGIVEQVGATAHDHGGGGAAGPDQRREPASTSFCVSSSSSARFARAVSSSSARFGQSSARRRNAH
jgi:hypothetical protein